MLIPETTKELIFDTALSLFAKTGYDAVSIRDIANGVGIKGASIYNHYNSKKEILDHIYDFYREHMFLGWITQEEMMAYVKEGDLESPMEGLAAGRYSNLEEKTAKRLMCITKLICSRMFCEDSAAAELYLRSADEGVSIVRKSLDYGVEIGRFRQFDTDGIAQAVVAMYTDMAVREFLCPDYEPRESEKREKISVLMGKLLKIMENEDYHKG